MSLENARVLHKTFMDLKDVKHAKQCEENYPELVGQNEVAKKVAEKPPIEPTEPVAEPIKRSNSHGKVRKR